MNLEYADDVRKMLKNIRGYLSHKVEPGDSTKPANYSLGDAEEASTQEMALLNRKWPHYALKNPAHYAVLCAAGPTYSAHYPGIFSPPRDPDHLRQVPFQAISVKSRWISDDLKSFLGLGAYAMLSHKEILNKITYYILDNELSEGVGLLPIDVRGITPASKALNEFLGCGRVNSLLGCGRVNWYSLRQGVHTRKHLLEKDCAAPEYLSHELMEFLGVSTLLSRIDVTERLFVWVRANGLDNGRSLDVWSGEPGAKILHALLRPEAGDTVTWDNFQMYLNKHFPMFHMANVVMVKWSPDEERRLPMDVAETIRSFLPHC
uniref:Uncharacterized protein n=1 Tax=viral metagenome TaxID=1070528 RepID=A0A6C0KDT5_9ZZZZ